VILRCTARLLSVIKERADSSMAGPSPEDWYGNLVWVDGRKCLLLTHAQTLFPIFAADVRTADLRPLGSFVVPLIAGALESEMLSPVTFGRLDPQDVHPAKTADRSILACMNDMMLMTRRVISSTGGVEHCDVARINRQLRRDIHNPRGRGYARPIDMARTWLPASE
jgi:hypothetical protein